MQLTCTERPGLGVTIVRLLGPMAAPGSTAALGDFLGWRIRAHRTAYWIDLTGLEQVAPDTALELATVLRVAKDAGAEIKLLAASCFTGLSGPHASLWVCRSEWAATAQPWRARRAESEEAQ
ncbi:MAG: hypothetical protein U0Q16_36595 [Bryobacteraceae bacterium]